MNIFQYSALFLGMLSLGAVAHEGFNASQSIAADNVDITDQNFTKRARDCSRYEGTYYSNVTDIQRAKDFMGDIVITADDTHCTIQSNDIPNHDFNDETAQFANPASEQNIYYQFARNPEFAANTTALGIGTTEGIFLNGVNLDILPAACYGVGGGPLGQERIGCGPDQNAHPWRYDPMSTLNNFGTDQHHAHVQPTGAYHYHGNPMAMFNQDCDGTTPSPVIGFAADGFPIFGACFRDPETKQIRKAASSYRLKNNGGARQSVAGYQTPKGGIGWVASDNYDGQFRGDWEFQSGAGDLDECNGMTLNGRYGYYVTDQFPWVINCFKGEPDDSFSLGNNALSTRSHAH